MLTTPAARFPKSCICLLLGKPSVPPSPSTHFSFLPPLNSGPLLATPADAVHARSQLSGTEDNTRSISQGRKELSSNQHVDQHSSSLNGRMSYLEIRQDAKSDWMDSVDHSSCSKNLEHLLRDSTVLDRLCGENRKCKNYGPRSQDVWIDPSRSFLHGWGIDERMNEWMRAQQYGMGYIFVQRVQGKERDRR